MREGRRRAAWRSRFSALILTTAAAMSGGAADAAASFSSDRFVIVPDQVVQPDGRLQSGLAVVVEGERIVKIVSADAAEHEGRLVMMPGTVLSPGLVDVGSTLGVHGQNQDGLTPIDPGVRVIEALDRFDPALRRAAASGITLAMVAPAADGLVTGSCAVIRTFVPDGHGGGGPEVLVEDAALAMALGPSALSFQRAPSSRAGAMAMLRDAFAVARSQQGEHRLHHVLTGRLPVLMRAGEGEDVSAALRLFDGTEVKVILQHGGDLSSLLDEFDGFTGAVVLGPFGPAERSSALTVPASLDAMEDVTFVLRGAVPARGADALRLTAAMAVRGGLSPERARRAVTSDAARVAGVRDQTGAIEPGLAADLVLFTADPLRSDARVAAVFVRGRQLPMPHLMTPEMLP